MTRRALRRIVLTEAAFVAASVLPLAALVAFLGSGILPIHDVVRLGFVEVRFEAMDAAMTKLQQAYPDVDVARHAIDGDMTEVVVRRDFSLRPGGDPSVSIITDMFAHAGHMSNISTAPELATGPPLVAWLPVVYGYAMFGTLGLIGLVLLRREPVSMPVATQTTPHRILAVCVLGWLGVVAVGWGSIQLPDQWPPATDAASIGMALATGGVAGIALACVVAPMAEEMLFRKWLYGGLIQDRVRGANAIQSALFALPHAPLFGLRGALAAWIAGMIFGWVYRRSGRIAAPVAVHGAYNGVVLASQHWW